MEATGSRVITYGREDAEFPIYGIYDIHWGNRGCSREYLRRDVQRIRKDPFAMWILGGDYFDMIVPGDSRFDADAVSPEIMLSDINKLAAALTMGLVDELDPISEKCLMGLMGNHEHQYMKRKDCGLVHGQVCERLGIPNGMYSAWCDLYFVHKKDFRGCTVEKALEPPQKYTARLRILAHHGFGGANTAGGKINKLKQLVDSVEADLVVMGHVHEAFTKAFVRLHPGESCDGIHHKITMGMISGSYLRTYASGFTSYGEQRGYFPTTLGASRARYKPIERTLTVENKAENVGKGPE